MAFARRAWPPILSINTATRDSTLLRRHRYRYRQRHARGAGDAWPWSRPTAVQPTRRRNRCDLPGGGGQHRLSNALNVTVRRSVAGRRPAQRQRDLRGQRQAASCGNRDRQHRPGEFRATGVDQRGRRQCAHLHRAGRFRRRASPTTRSLNTATAQEPSLRRHRQRTDNDTLAAQADLAITKLTAGQCAPGTATTYTIVVSNNGPSDVVADGTVSDSCRCSTAERHVHRCRQTGGAVRASRASGADNINDTVNVPAGSTITYTLVANISGSARGDLVNTATVTPPAAGHRHQSGNNSATDSDTLAPQADLAITKADGVVNVVPGTTTTVRDRGQQQWAERRGRRDGQRCSARGDVTSDTPSPRSAAGGASRLHRQRRRQHQRHGQHAASAARSPTRWSPAISGSASGTL